MPTKIDTFYLLEAYDVESGSYIGKIWNAQNGLDFNPFCNYPGGK